MSTRGTQANRIHTGRQDRLFDFTSTAVLTLSLMAVLYPLYFIVISSISDFTAVSNGLVIGWPVGVTFEGYERLLADRSVWRGYLNSLIYTVTATAISVTITVAGAIVLSRRTLPGRRTILVLILFTMLFQGGLIPRYLVVRDLGLLNSIWAVVLPQAVSVWNLIVARTFIATTIPYELEDAARIDGCDHIGFFIRIVVPLSPTLIAIMILFYSVQNWNMFFDALIFLHDVRKHPLQLVLRNILIMHEAMETHMSMDADAASEMMRAAEQIKYGLIIVASAPMLAIYPFLQRYFVKGVMVGGLKG